MNGKNFLAASMLGALGLMPGMIRADAIAADRQVRLVTAAEVSCSDDAPAGVAAAVVYPIRRGSDATGTGATAGSDETALLMQ